MLPNKQEIVDIHIYDIHVYDIHVYDIHVYDKVNQYIARCQDGYGV